MKIELLFFGITTDLVGKNSLKYQLSENATVKDLKDGLVADFDSLAKIDEYAIAVNENYANEEVMLSEGDLVAIIPPVSGG
jgi:molybdopterin converting factor subunit 1